MEQHSGDGEPNCNSNGECSSEEQCKQKYAAEGENIPFLKSSDSVPITTTPSQEATPLTNGNKATTMFNLGAAPFIASSSPSLATPPSVHSPSNGCSGAAPASGDNNRLYPWNGGIMTTSTPHNNNNTNKDHPHSHQNGVVNVSAANKDIMELNNRLNAMCGLGPTSAMQSTRKSMTAAPENILRHLNNNNNIIMGNILQETNPPPSHPIHQASHSAMGPRSASDYRAYFNSNLINRDNELLMGGGGNFLQRVLTTNNNINQVAAVSAGNPLHPPQVNGRTNNNHCSSNGLYYRFDMENNNHGTTNNNRQRHQTGIGSGPATSPGPVPTMGGNININNNSTNQFQHSVRGGIVPSVTHPPPAQPLPPQQPNHHYGDDHFLVSHQNGIIQLKLKDGIEIEMTLDGAIRVINWRCNVSISLASSSNSAALIHPNGRVLQYHSRVEIMTYDGKSKNNFVRFAKIWYKGISFTSENNALVYLVDSGGTRTTTDSFMDLRNDITEQVFLTGSTHGPAYDNQAKKEVMNHKYWPALDGTEVHELNGFRIAQTVDGMVRITKTNKNILVRTSPGNGSATLTTAYIHCTASLGQTSHLFVRRGERRMHFDGAEFVVRNSGHSAGFDSNNLLRVY